MDETAGYYVSRETLRPLAVSAVSDLPAAIEAAGIELRPVDGLYRLHREVVGSTLQFSGMRLRNALDFVAEAAT